MIKFSFFLFLLFSPIFSIFATNTEQSNQIPETEQRRISDTLPLETPLHEKTLPRTSLKTLIAWGNFEPFSLLSLKRPIFIGDITKDDSILRYVSSDVTLNDIDYRPKNLVSISGSHINQAGRSSLIRADVKPHLNGLAQAFYEHFREPLVAISAFRSAEYQQRLWDLGRCEWGAFCAIPGRSEHQLGLALDFFDATSETEYLSNPRYRGYVEWMEKNAYLYGFTRSYKNGPILDNYEPEPWHWRYVGVDMATRLHNLDWSYTEYVKFLRNMSGW